MDPSNLNLLRDAFAKYRLERTTFLHKLGCPGSNRDPLAEFSERLVATLVKGQLVESRVQPDYDIIGPEGERIQVKYLANPLDKWINEHEIKFTPNMDSYALVFFENLQLVAVLLFSQAGIEGVCQALKKRHPNQDKSLQLTQRNFRQILDSAETFQRFGARVLYPSRPTDLS
jgi:hypothetical protein